MLSCVFRWVTSLPSYFRLITLNGMLLYTFDGDSDFQGIHEDSETETPHTNVVTLAGLFIKLWMLFELGINHSGHLLMFILDVKVVQWHSLEKQRKRVVRMDFFFWCTNVCVKGARESPELLASREFTVWWKYFRCVHAALPQGFTDSDTISLGKCSNLSLEMNSC